VRNVSEVEIALADIDFGNFDQVGHQVVELLRFMAGSGNELGLKGVELTGEALAKSVKAAAQLEERVTEFAAGNAEKLGLEAVGVLEAGDVFEGGDGAQETAVGVAHGRGAQSKVA